ncbi:MAG: hypothetical protein QXR48_01245 [Candidatus Woesearchaeota archaeon]
MNPTERFHTWTHLTLFLMLFMITLAVMKFSTPTGLATGNQTFAANGIGDFKPFLTAVGLLMTMLIVALIICGKKRPARQGEEKNFQETIPAQQHSLDEINRQLAELRKKLR